MTNEIIPFKEPSTLAGMAAKLPTLFVLDAKTVMAAEEMTIIDQTTLSESNVHDTHQIRPHITNRKKSISKS